MIPCIVWSQREKSNKIPSQNSETIVLYNNIIHMYIFDVSIYGLHIAPSWYGAMYAIWFLICYFFIKKQFLFQDKTHLDSLLTYVFFGVILWWRIWYIIFYNLSYFIENPSSVIKIWEWGMSFHGWFLGVVLSVYLFARKYKYSFWWLIDTLAVIVPIAIWLWRIGNWINIELPGYTPYAGIFGMKINWINHFPSPLLEMLLEGILLFIVMLLFYKYKRNRSSGFLSGIFLIWYSWARLLAENFRLPDEHIGYLFWTDYITLWIIYTIPMVVFWIYLISIKKL
jgi:phosphatidylglycerol:prolipoprotein diacylglycerol transferase